ncbi:MAG: tellurite resistance TerB family protein [Gammaproteobacteria bacterium]|nr:tellurite resistance TerB family protein [Gammaproteobacteria bacterium]
MDTKKLLEILTQNPGAGAAAGGLAGSLLGNVLNGGRGGRKALKYGSLAAVGYVAYQAWQKRQAQKQGGPAAVTAQAGGLEALLGQVLGTGAGAGATAAGKTGAPLPALPRSFDLEAPANSAGALRVVRAMIAASKADGSIDVAERDRIFARVGESGLSQAEHDEVLRLLGQPADLEAIVAGVDSKELATEIYAASLLAVSPANRAERAWLDMLAARLGLESELTLELDRSVEVLARQA